MSRRLALLLAGALACTCPVSAQTPPADGVETLLARLQTIMQGGDAAGLAALVGPAFPPDELQNFQDYLLRADTRRAVVAERDRTPLTGALPGDGYRLMAELYSESSDRARIVTVLLDIRRPTGGSPDTWRISGAQVLTSIDGLFRLRINTTAQFSARNFSITAEDLVVTLTDGSVFLIESENGVTGLVLLGRGLMRFTPGPETERGQLRIFSGGETLQAPFEWAFVRLSPVDYEQRATVANLTPATLNPRDLRRAQEILAREGSRSFSLDLRDLSSDPWSLLPPVGDFLAEIRTRRQGTLTYTRTGTQAEDITLFDRDDRHTIALYPSAQRRAANGGLSFNEDERRDYDVLDYDIEANISPETERLEGRVRMRIRTRSPEMSSLLLRLADELTVRNIVSVEYGRLLHLRVRDQDNIIVNFPVPLHSGADVTLVVTYAGRIAPQDIEDEGAQDESRRDEPLLIPLEPNFLLSSRSYWYPQNPVADYATATLRVIIPEGYGCAASGLPRNGDEVTLRDLLTLTDGRSFVFTAREPLRYFAVVVSKFVRVVERTIGVNATATNGAGADSGSANAAAGEAELRIAIDANPRQQSSGRALGNNVEAIMRYYSGVIGDLPYGSITVALVEDELPGGHSPGYMAVLNNPLPTSRYTWRSDPAAFSGFPEFFVAHELAHQWWGQAVGWRNYHEQWLSEGFAQYFAALYAQHARGERTFVDMLRQFRRWAIAESEEGPISLGSRLGHIKNDRRVFRALVYNKGAAVLHMLRRLIGDEAFFNGMRRFYTEQKFRKSGTDDVRAAFEATSGRTLDRFFEQWIYGVGIPRLRYTTTVQPGAVAVHFEQLGSTMFDVPVTVSVVYADGRIRDEVVPVTEQRVEWKSPSNGAVKRILVNRDYAAVAVFERY
jgi:peptidase M1-like protein